MKSIVKNPFLDEVISQSNNNIHVLERIKNIQLLKEFDSALKSLHEKENLNFVDKQLIKLLKSIEE